MDTSEAPGKKTNFRTPMFEAMHAARYQRQALIKKVETETGRSLVCYVSGRTARIDRDDVLAVVDLLHNLPRNCDLDFLLHTGGGDLDAAEKLLSLIRNVVGGGILRIVVPDYAKSAGTLVALGADRIVMSDSSELGPIDPQITLDDGHGNRIPHSVQTYLDAYEEHSNLLKADPSNVAAKVMIGKLDPATVKLFKAARERARRFAEEQLRRYMFRDGAGNYTKIAADLIDTNRWLSHGQMIGHQDASEIGLVVDYLDQQTELWQGYWRIYCLQRLALTDKQKLFESSFASLSFDA